MDKFLKYKKTKKLENVLETKKEEKVIKRFSNVRIVKGPHKGLDGVVRDIKENKWIYITTCMNEYTTRKIPIEYAILKS